MVFESLIVGFATYYSVARSNQFVVTQSDLVAANGYAERQAIARLHVPDQPDQCPKASDGVVVENGVEGASVASMVPHIAAKLLSASFDTPVFIDGGAKEIKASEDGRFLTFDVPYQAVNFAMDGGAAQGATRTARLIATRCANGALAFTQVRIGK